MIMYWKRRQLENVFYFFFIFEELHVDLRHLEEKRSMAYTLHFSSTFRNMLPTDDTKKKKREKIIISITLRVME